MKTFLTNLLYWTLSIILVAFLVLWWLFMGARNTCFGKTPWGERTEYFKEIHIYQGQNLASAIKKAKSGDIFFLYPGTYNQQRRCDAELRS
mgnify:CR=1 FL=1